MAFPVVSVIITSFNYAEYIARTIDSVLSQTYPAIELIVVDDGSTDDSLAIIASFGNRLRYIARAPMLLITGAEDRICPPAVNIANFKQQRKAPSATEHKEYPGRCHFPGQDGWEEVADFALQWASEHAIDQVTYDDVKSAFPAETTSSTTRNPELRA